jgi:hypothetical protein
MQQISSIEEIDWIGVGTAEIPSSPDQQHVSLFTVASCIPPIFPAYAKIFHAIYEDLSIANRDLTWNQEEIAETSGLPPSTDPVEQLMEKSTLVYGAPEPDAQLRRVSWSVIAERYGLRYTPTLHVGSFNRRFLGASWPRYLVGPMEGCLADDERDALAAALDRELKGGDCYFYFWLLATEKMESDLLYRGPLREVGQFASGINTVRLTPTYWFPPDRSWLVHSDYDSTYTLIGGREQLIESVLHTEGLEALRVTSETPLGSLGDKPNLTS